MIRDLYLFFKNDKTYFLLFLLVLIFYGLLGRGESVSEKRYESSNEYQAFRHAEEKWNEEISNKESFNRLMKKKPVLAAVFQMFLLLIFLGFIVGSVIDFLFFVNKKFRGFISTGLSPPDSPDWKLASLFKVVLLFLMTAILLSVIFGMFRAFSPLVGNDNFYMILHTVTMDFLCIFFIVAILRENGICWTDLGFRKPKNGIFREICTGFLGYMAVLPLFFFVLFLLLFISKIFSYEPPPHPLVSMFLEEEKRSQGLIVFSIFLATVIGPILEEIFFRGFCYTIFRVKWGKTWAMIISSAFFGLIHHSGFAFWPIFILGIMLSYLYEKRGSLIAPITLHIIHNMVFLGYFLLAKQMVMCT